MNSHAIQSHVEYVSYARTSTRDLNERAVNNNATNNQNNSVKTEIIHCKFKDQRYNYDLSYPARSLNERRVTVEEYNKAELDKDKIDYMNQFSQSRSHRPLSSKPNLYSTGFSSYEQRLDSFNPPVFYRNFDELAWNDLGIKTELLAISGFYSRAPGDTVICHYCNIRLCNFEKGDNELLEHVRFSPECEYIKEAMYQLYLGPAN